MPRCHRTIVGLAVLVLIAIPGIRNESTAAPTQKRSALEIELHLGALAVNNLKGGTDRTSVLAEPGPSFVTVNGTTSRRVPSFFFGDGARLLNQSLSPTAPRIDGPFDAVLGKPFFESQGGAGGGFRVARPLVSRLSVEFSFDYTRKRIVPTPSARGINTSAQMNSWQSLIAAWKSEAPGRQGDLSYFPDFNGFGSAAVRPRGSETLTTGTIVFAPKPDERIVPYVVGGGGLVRRSATDFSIRIHNQITLRGDPLGVTYALDSLLIRPDFSRNSFVGVIGGGVKYHITSHWGVRWDARVHLAQESLSTVVSANVGPGCSGSVCFPISNVVLGGEPSIQFSDRIPDSRGMMPETVTFSGSFVQRRTLITGGIFFKIP